jgi:hypothetical protein
MHDNTKNIFLNKLKRYKLTQESCDYLLFKLTALEFMQTAIYFQKNEDFTERNNFITHSKEVNDIADALLSRCSDKLAALESVQDFNNLITDAIKVVYKD